MARSRWKFSFIGNDLKKYIVSPKKRTKKNIFVLQNRATFILINMIDIKVKVYNGMRYFSFTIEKDMLGHLLGEFAPTKKKASKKKKIKIKKKTK